MHLSSPAPAVDGALHRAGAAAVPEPPAPPAALPTALHTALPTARPTALPAAAALARTLAEALLGNVQRATALNVAAARALLRHARLQPPPSLEPRTEAWRWAWRSFEVCATSADAIIGLTRGQVDRGTQAVWRQAEHWIDEVERACATPHGHGPVHELRAAFTALERAQQACWEASVQAHGALLQWAQGATASGGMDAGVSDVADGDRPGRTMHEGGHAAH